MTVEIIKTDTSAKNAKPSKSDYRVEGNPGLYLRVTAAGVRSWRVIYRVKIGPDKGKQRFYTIGRYPDLSLKDARGRAGDVQTEVRNGGDPAKAWLAELQAPAPAVKTYGEVVADYIAKVAKPRQKTHKETERILKSVPWIDRDIKSITKQEAYDLIDGIVAAGKQAKARVTLTWLRHLFKWASGRDIVEASPIAEVEVDFERRRRERFYTDDEIKKIWDAANKLPPMEGAYIKELVLTGVRKNELAKMRRSECTDTEDGRVWIVPHERTKSKKTSANKRVYVVPLAPMAVSIMDAAPRLDDDLVFRGRHKGKSLDPGTPLKERVKRNSGIDDWYYHAHRDTIATWAHNNGASNWERKLLLNHSEADVTEGYSKGYPVQVKRQWMERWADHVAELVGEPLPGENVIPLRRG